MRYVKLATLALTLSLFAGCFGGGGPAKRGCCYAAPPACTCGPNCAAGGNCDPCYCAARWLPAIDGTDDQGLWDGDTFLGRWIAKTNRFRKWDGKAYGLPVAVSTLPKHLWETPIKDASGNICLTCRR